MSWNSISAAEFEVTMCEATSAGPISEAAIMAIAFPRIIDTETAPVTVRTSRVRLPSLPERSFAICMKSTAATMSVMQFMRYSGRVVTAILSRNTPIPRRV